MTNQKEAFARLYADRSDATFADYIIECENTEIRVHRNVVCGRCEFLNKACTNGFTETVDYRVKLHNDDLRSIERLVEYLYTWTYTIDTKDESTNLLLAHIQMYSLGIKYNVDGLERIALQNFREIIRVFPGFQLDTFIVEAIRAAFTLVPEIERRVLLDELFGTRDGMDLVSIVATMAEFRELCEEIGSVGYAFFMGSSKHYREQLSVINAANDALKTQNAGLAADFSNMHKAAETQRVELTTRLKNMSENLTAHNARAERAERKAQELEASRRQQEVESASQAGVIDTLTKRLEDTRQRGIMTRTNAINMQLDGGCRKNDCRGGEFALRYEIHATYGLTFVYMCVNCKGQHRSIPEPTSGMYLNLAQNHY